MACGPITSWQIDGEKMETVADFIFLGSKIRDGDCSHEIQRCLLLGRKAITHLNSILKSRDISLPKKSPYSQIYGFSITSWHLGGEIMETVTDFVFLGSKITANGDCSYAVTRRLLLGRKVMTNLDRILKSRDITLLTIVHLVNLWLFQ